MATACGEAGREAAMAVRLRRTDALRNQQVPTVSAPRPVQPGSFFDAVPVITRSVRLRTEFDALPRAAPAHAREGRLDGSLRRDPDYTTVPWHGDGRAVPPIARPSLVGRTATMPAPMHRLSLPLSLTLVLAATPAAQDDLRDRVTRADGKVLTGRVQNPFGVDEILLLQGGKRVRVARPDIAAMDLVGDRVREFCERRVRLRNSPKAQTYLIDWAATRQLPGLARAQATWLALQDEGNTTAHEFLGHSHGPKGWLWPHDGRKWTRAQLDTALAREPMTITGERFALRCSADLVANVAALLDLEHLGVAWQARFGEALQLREVLAPIDVVVSPSADEFPKWGFRPLPFYEPPPHDDVAHTFATGLAGQRPPKLFFVGTQGLLYHTLIGEVSRRDDRDRVCAWLEVGLGMVMQNTMQGDPGFAAPGEPRRQDLQALTALGRDYRIQNLLHLPMYSAFYLMDDTPSAINWSAATMFTTWLLEPDNTPRTREPFLRFIRASLGERKGDSSSAFDKIMGVRVEDLDAPWRAWLAKTAGH